MARTHPFDTHSDEYELWFDRNQNVFQSELNALRNVFPAAGRGVEIGVGSGIFAEPLGIPEGIEPSAPMRNRAKQRNIKAINGIAESLPYPDKSLDFAVMITTICFVDDVYQSMYEVHRVLKDGGSLIIGFVDKDSTVGREYLAHKEESIFYREAVFYGTEELYGILDDTGFIIEKTNQTVFGKLDEVNEVQDVLEGYGQGSFVVIKASKRTTGAGR